MSDESVNDGDVEPPDEPRDDPEENPPSDGDSDPADADSPDTDDDADGALEKVDLDEADDSDDSEESDDSDNSDEPDDLDDSDDSEGPDDLDEADEQPEIETDGEGLANDRQGEQEATYPDPDDDVGGISTPPDDEEMPLADHIEEMVLRLAVVLLFGAAGTAIGLLWASQAISHVWINVFPTQLEQVPPHVYHPLELWLTRIKLSALLGIMIALPMFIYQCYLFMRPGLYPHERKYYLAAVPTSVVLAALGMVFSYLLILPILFQYFTFYAEGSADIAYALGETFDLIITLTGFLAIVFQIPLLIMLAIMIGVTTRQWLADKRLYFWAAFAGLSFMFTMDPTGMAPIIVAITMILLFEGTLLILKWTGR